MKDLKFYKVIRPGFTPAFCYTFGIDEKEVKEKVIQKYGSALGTKALEIKGEELLNFIS